MPIFASKVKVPSRKLLLDEYVGCLHGLNETVNTMDICVECAKRGARKEHQHANSGGSSISRRWGRRPIDARNENIVSEVATLPVPLLAQTNKSEVRGRGNLESFHKLRPLEATNTNNTDGTFDDIFCVGHAVAMTSIRKQPSQINFDNPEVRLR